MAPPLHRIVIVGGGAGGIELATRLGDKLGRRGQGAHHADRPLAHAPVEAAAARVRRRHAWTSTSMPSTTLRRRAGTTSASSWARWTASIACGGLVLVAPDPRRGRAGTHSAARDRLRHARHRRRQPQQRFRHSRRARARDQPRPGRPGRPVPSPPDQRLHPRQFPARAAAPGAVERRHHRCRRDRRGARRRAAQEHARAGGLRARSHRPGKRRAPDDHRGGAARTARRARAAVAGGYGAAPRA